MCFCTMPAGCTRHVCRDAPRRAPGNRRGELTSRMILQHLILILILDVQTESDMQRLQKLQVQRQLQQQQIAAMISTRMPGS
jgi:hypothetical protein